MHLMQYSTHPVLFQNVFRKVQQNKLAQLYLVDEHFRTNIEMISTLVSVPTNIIFNSFEILKQEIGNDEQPILDYFECDFIGEVTRGVRRQPLFHHKLWNVHERVNMGIPRTTNALETQPFFKES